MAPHLPDHLQFAASNLFVAYRASDRPQVLDLYVETSAPSSLRHAPYFVRNLIEEMNGGAAGGPGFRPSLGRARLLAGPAHGDDAGAAGPTYRFSLEVVSLAPRFVRHLVEILAMLGLPDGKATSVVVNGSLPPDDSDASVRENGVRAWLSDPLAYPAAFDPLPYPVVDVDNPVDRAAFVRLLLGRTVTKEILAAVEEALLLWSGALLGYPGPNGLGTAETSLVASTSRAGSEVTAHFPTFRCERAPARDLLLNVMTRFHETVAPVERLEIGLPA